jgi:ATP/ADP translocase
VPDKGRLPERQPNSTEAASFDIVDEKMESNISMMLDAEVVKVCSEIAETIKPAECQFRVGHTLLLTAVLVSVGCTDEHIVLLKSALSRTALMLDQTRRFKKIKSKLEYHGFSVRTHVFPPLFLVLFLFLFLLLRLLFHHVVARFESGWVAHVKFPSKEVAVDHTSLSIPT